VQETLAGRRGLVARLPEIREDHRESLRVVL
jgi:hypothetical protein